MEPNRELRRSFRGTLDGVGAPGPIEERIGRRLIRVVDPDSAEGARLVRDHRVEWIGPEGDSFGPVGLEEAWDLLRRRLERRIAEPVEDPEDGRALRDGLQALTSRSRS